MSVLVSIVFLGHHTLLVLTIALRCTPPAIWPLSDSPCLDTPLFIFVNSNLSPLKTVLGSSAAALIYIRGGARDGRVNPLLRRLCCAPISFGAKKKLELVWDTYRKRRQFTASNAIYREQIKLEK